MVYGGAKCLKYCIFVFNIFIFFCGLGLIGIGSYFLTVNRTYISLLADDSMVVPILLITVGLVVAITAFLACGGAICESPKLLFTYSALVSMIFIAEITGGAIAFSKKDELQHTMARKILQSMMKYYQKDMLVTELWDSVQEKMDCCGAHGFLDWIYVSSIVDNGMKLPENFNPLEGIDHAEFMDVFLGQLTEKPFPFTAKLKERICEKFAASFVNGSLPDTCCITVGNCWSGDITTIRNQGCFKKLRALLTNNLYIVGGIAIGTGLIQIAGIFAACFLANRIKKQNTKMELGKFQHYTKSADKY